MDQIFNHLLYLKPFNCVQMELVVLSSNTWNHWIVGKQMSSGSFKDVTYKLFLYKSYIMHMYKHEKPFNCVETND